MPTPQWIKDRAREARKRTCVICGAEHFVKKSSHAGKTCSGKCLSALKAQLRTGQKTSAETKSKLSAAIKRKYEDPAFAEKQQKATREAQKRWHDDPENAASFARRSSERMKRRHADPKWQKVRDERSSRVMKANWEKHRDTFVRQAIDRYARMKDEGTGIVSEQSEAKKRKAAKWIMKRASDAMHAETDYNETYAEVQARIRRERPFEPGGDYYEYCKWLGAEVVNSPECREIADSFMSEAIPRFAAEWQQKKVAE